VTVRFRLDNGGKTLKVDYDAKYHHPPKKVVLHVPPLPKIRRISVNAQVFSAKANDVITLKPIPE
jgi:hypothetical protein